MLYRTIVLIAVVSMSSGCAHDNLRFAQADADALSERCGASKSWTTVHPDGTVQFEPPMDADYDVSLCLLNGIKEAGVTKMGFVGNERAPESEGK
jgi:hypothetical protein